MKSKTLIVENELLLKKKSKMRRGSLVEVLWKQVEAGREMTIDEIAQLLHGKVNVKTVVSARAVVRALRDRLLREGVMFFCDKKYQQKGVYKIDKVGDLGARTADKKAVMVKSSFASIARIQTILESGELEHSEEFAKEVKRTTLLLQKFIVESDLRKLGEATPPKLRLTNKK